MSKRAFFMRLFQKLSPLIEWKKSKCFMPLSQYSLNYSSNSHSPQGVYLVDEDKNDRLVSTKKVNKYTERTFTCGDLRSENVGLTVTLCGWLEYQRMQKFVIIRDSYGETQLLIQKNDLKTQDLVRNASLESIIKVTGTVLFRPKDMINSNQPTGEIEVLIDEFTVLNKADSNLPFNIREFQKAKEALRMQYRYIDLRFSQMQRNLRARSQVLMKMREFLINSHFVDIETPTLFKATPGGAQEFIVPTQLPGQFYCLVQSPQQFKQMLMAGAIDRYFQIARCYRDETSRPDRQPEFTQLDVEMSFTSVDGVINLIEELLNYSWPDFVNTLPNKFRRIKFADAMELYGTDKPDVTFDFMLENCTKLIKTSGKLPVDEDFSAYCLKFPKNYGKANKSIKIKIETLQKQYSSVKLVQSKVTTPVEWSHKMDKLLSAPLALALADQIQLEDDSILFLAYGKRKQVVSLLGKIRLEYVNHLEQIGLSIRKKGMNLLWVTDFPLFEEEDVTGVLQSAHHPFTAPHPEDLHLLDTSPLKVRGLAYDLVLNGNEIGGGSIRIHEPALQKKIFEMLNIDVQNMQHILNMLSSGCPPHGGIALGLDRLLSILLNTTSIRDVIAFPKGSEGRDPVCGAPSPISDAEKKLYHIKSV